MGGVKLGSGRILMAKPNFGRTVGGVNLREVFDGSPIKGMWPTFIAPLPSHGEEIGADTDVGALAAGAEIWGSAGAATAFTITDASASTNGIVPWGCGITLTKQDANANTEMAIEIKGFDAWGRAQTVQTTIPAASVSAPITVPWSEIVSVSLVSKGSSVTTVYNAGLFIAGEATGTYFGGAGTDVPMCGVACPILPKKAGDIRAIFASAGAASSYWLYNATDDNWDHTTTNGTTTALTNKANARVVNLNTGWMNLPWFDATAQGFYTVHYDLDAARAYL